MATEQNEESSVAYLRKIYELMLGFVTSDNPLLHGGNVTILKNEGTIETFIAGPVPTKDVPKQLSKAAECGPEALMVLNDFDRLINDKLNKEKLKSKLRILLEGKKGRDVALVIQCCLDLGLLFKAPTYRAIMNEFGNFGCKTAYYDGLKVMFTENEKAPIKAFLLS